MSEYEGIQVNHVCGLSGSSRHSRTVAYLHVSTVVIPHHAQLQLHGHLVLTLGDKIVEAADLRKQAFPVSGDAASRILIALAITSSSVMPMTVCKDRQLQWYPNADNTQCVTPQRGASGQHVAV